jgi:hypothetical protein
MAEKLMVIQRLDTCVSCAQTLAPKTCAWWDSAERTVTCTACRPTGVLTSRAARTTPRPPTPIAHRAGSISAMQEYERRVAKLRRQPGVIFGEEVVGDIGVHLADESPPTAF